MKKLATCLLAAATLAAGNAQDAAAAPRTLVAYFSATGTTAAAAQKLAKVTGGELWEIAPAQPYTPADLDWTNHSSRSYVEMHDAASRPALKGKKENIAEYDVVYIGYPIWWHVAPTIINTFIENHDLKGKTLSPFATSGSQDIEFSVDKLMKTYPTLNWKPGKLLNGATESSIRTWVGK